LLTLFLRKMIMKNGILVLIIALTAFVLSACGPRGESRPLDDILESSKQRYNMVRRTEVPAEVRETLDRSVTRLEDLLREVEIAENASDISIDLLTLTEHTGYTNRPSMFELIKQYQAMSERASQTGVNQASVKLLVSRTYALLASELETTRFSL